MPPDPSPLIAIDMHSYMEALPADITIALDGKDTKKVIAAHEVDGWVEVVTTEVRDDKHVIERRHGSVRIGNLTNEQRARFVERFPTSRELEPWSQ